MKLEETKLFIRAVAYPEGGLFTIQGIEYDIVAHAKHLSELPFAFHKAIAENIAVNLHLGRAPLGGIPPAPPRFRVMFDQAETEVSPVKPIESLGASAPKPKLSVRLLENAA